MKIPSRKSFSATEILMLALTFSVLGVVALPGLSRVKKEVKNAAALSALAEMRMGLALAAKLIAVKEDPTVRRSPYPTLEELRSGTFLDAHPSLRGKKIFNSVRGKPENPWTRGELPETAFTEIFDCDLQKGTLLQDGDRAQRGWCYRSSTGEIWLNTNQNRDPAGFTENHF